MGKSHKTGRLGEEIRKIIGDMLIHQLKDPRLSTGLISVTAVDVSGDGSIATVFLSFLPFDRGVDEIDLKSDILEAMNKSKGAIKKEIGRHIKIRHIPELIFKFDTSLEYGRHIEELIQKVNKNEE